MENGESFLTAEWRHLVMVNYAIEPKHLICRVPAGTELDRFENTTYVSMVAFKFLNTKIKTIGIPFHRNFEEINLRFYVRRKEGDAWKRGVVFVKEIVPRAAISLIARTLYNENYVTLPTRHTMKEPGPQCRYEWRTKTGWNFIEAKGTGQSHFPEEESEEQFISEHYWGYTSQRDGSTKEYEVEHPPWKIWNCSGAQTQIEVENLYGEEFVEALSQPPKSVFIAEGSEVSVSKGKKLQPGNAAYPKPANEILENEQNDNRGFRSAGC